MGKSIAEYESQRKVIYVLQWSKGGGGRWK